MAFTERLKVVIDVVTGNATNSLSSFRKSVADADGFTGKLKAGVGSLSSAFTSAVSSPMAMAGAMSTAAVAAVKLTNDYVDQVKAAADLADATGLTIEEASRFTAVADDAGVSADSLIGGLKKISSTLDAQVWTDYGIATRDASGQARSANVILNEAFVVLNSIENSTERAAAGQKMFGKGWKDMAPILALSKGNLDSLLRSVDQSEVYTEKERKAAEKWRLAMDNLSDSFKNLKNDLGGAITEMSDAISAINGVANAIDWLGDRADSGPLEGLAGHVYDVLNPVHAAVSAIDQFGDTWASVFGDDPGKGARDVAADFATIGNRETVTSINTLRDAVGEVGEKAYFTAGGIKDVSEEFATLLGQIDQRSQLRNLMDDFDDVESAAKEYYDAAATGAEDVEQKQRAYEQAIDDSKVAVIEYADEIGGIPPAAVTNIIAQIDQGSIDNARRLLASLGDLRITYYGRINEQGIPARALGGPVSKDSMYQVGEGGKPELLTDAQGRTYLIPGTNGVVTPIGSTGSTGSAGGNTFNITITKPMVSGEQLANELKKYISRNGSAWLS